MKYLKLIIISLICLLASCVNTKKKYVVDEFTQKQFKDAYKTAVFYGCFNKATDNQLNQLCEKTKDLKLASETAVVLHAGIEEAVALGENEALKIQKIEYDDYQGKRPLLSHCYCFSISQKVDSIASVKYGKH